MKKYLLSLALVALLASPSFAYVQSGHLLSNSAGNNATESHASRLPSWIDGRGPLSSPGMPDMNPPRQTLDEGPGRPIPEPGTMALASLGLLALGVSRARRRGH